MPIENNPIALPALTKRTLEQQNARKEGLLFDRFWFDLRNEQLFRDEEPIPLKPKAIRVLARLLSARGGLVSKRDLLRHAWSEVTVGEGVLKVCISEIRAALRDAPESPRFIQTVHGRGYRFIAEVREQAELTCEQHFFIGRQPERALLSAAWEQAAAGNGQMLLVTGEPGIGKSALLETFLRQLESSRAAWLFHGRCAAHGGEREPYMPLLEAFGRLGRSSESAILLPALIKYAPTWAIQLPSLLTVEQVPLVRQQVLGATLGRMLREVGDFIEEICRQLPVVLSVEDLQWSDRATLDLLEYLGKRRSSARLLLVATSRSWESESATDNELTASLFTSFRPSAWRELALSPFSVEEVCALLRERFQAPAWASDVAERLHQQTGGNPLFLNSVLNHQVRSRCVRYESNGWAWHDKPEAWRVPLELRGFIQHWFAQRSIADRRVIEAASVAGREFDPVLLAAVLEQPINEVRRQCELQTTRGFFEPAADLEPDLGGASEVYRFTHALIQQVVHDSLSNPARAAYHQKTASCLSSARVNPARLSYHYEQCGAYLEAVEYRTRAGESAHAAYAYHDAVDHFEAALDLLRRVPEAPNRQSLELRILLGLGQPLVNLHGWTAPLVEAAYRRAYNLCRDARGSHHFASLAGLYKYFLARGHFETALEIAVRCHECAEELGLRPLRMTAHAMVGFAHYFRSDLASARTELEASRALYDYNECQSFAQMFGDDPGVGCLGFLARVEVLTGELELGRELAQQAVTLARRLAHPHVIATALALSAHVEAWTENDRAVASLVEELASISRTQSFALWTVIARFFSAWVRCRAGYHGGLAEAWSAFAQYDRIGAVADRATYAVLLAGLLLRQSSHRSCLEFVQAALKQPPRVQIWDSRLEQLRSTCAG